MKQLIFVTMVFWTLVYTSCTDKQPLPEGCWIIETAYGENIVVADTAYITFEPGVQKVHGCNGCNRFFGPCEIEGNTISLQNLATTMMACPDSPSEADIMKAFGETKTYKIEEVENVKTLRLYNSENKEVLTLSYTSENK